MNMKITLQYWVWAYVSLLSFSSAPLILYYSGNEPFFLSFVPVTPLLLIGGGCVLLSLWGLFVMYLGKTHCSKGLFQQAG